MIDVTATFVARLWLPDIPGTLGLVAAAIGRAGGDVTGIEILERGAGLAIDELLIELPDPTRVESLITEVSAVPGVNVEDVHQVDPERQDQSILALDVAARIVETPADRRLESLCESIRSMLEADWCTVIGRRPETVQNDVRHNREIANREIANREIANREIANRELANRDVAVGVVPDPAWLRAFLEGIGHLDADSTFEHTPGDVAWAPLSRSGFVVCGRQSRSFRSRERQHLALIVRIVDSVLGAGPMSGTLHGA